MEGVHPIFRSLESTNAQDTEDARIRFHEYFNSTKDPWLMNGIFDYYLQSGSLRIVDLIVGVREPHERYFFDRLSDCLINSHSPQIKLQALTLLGHVVCRHPSWLYKIMHHRLIKDLLRLLKAEKDVTTLVSALLIVIILLPTIAGLMGPHLQDLFDVFSHLASWNTKNPHKVPDNQLLHLQMGLYALFNRLYGMYPCNFLNYLRAHYSVKENHPIFHDTIKPMLDTVKIHPFLVTASKESEVLPARWKMLEANDVIMECAKFSVDTSPERSRDESFRSRAASFRARPIDYSSIFEKSQSQEEEGEKQVGGFSSNLPGHEIWSPTVYTGTTTPPEAASITHTPITQAYVSSTAAYSSQEGNSPPEAAIEATPESTPVKDLRQPVFRAANLSRSLGQSQPSSPLRKESPNPFRYPPNSSTPLPGHDQSPGSAFHQQPPSKAKDPSKLFASKLQRMHQERVLIQTEEEVASLAKARVGSSGSGYYPPGSPLRLITPSPSFVGSPHPPERSEEDKEVETTMQTNKSGSSLKRSKREEDQEEHDECTDDEHQINSDGGLRFPDSQTMAQFVGRVERLRYHSQCQPDTPIIQLATLATSSGSSPREGGDFATTIVRRAQSCPEIKKNLAQSSLAPCSTTLDETEEDQEDAENLSVNFKSAKMLKELSECGTQTEDQPMVYEHMFLSVFPPWEHIQQHSAPPDLHPAPTFQEQMFSPRTALESYVASMLRSSNEKRTKPDEIKSLRDQVELLMHQLQFERHRREVHAERNRRLLGKSRANRALEEHNSALRDQINLMHRDIESYHAEIEKCKIGAGQRCDNLQHEVNYWKDQSNAVQRRLKETETENALLRKELEENKKQFSSLAKKYALAQSQISDMNNTVQDTRLAASSSSELKGEIAMLQHHLISAGELEMRLRSSLNTLNLNCHKDMEAILGNMAYSHALSGLKAEMKTRTSAFQALTAKTQEMEKGFLRREELLRLENKKLADKVEEESRGKLKETEQDLKELKLVVSSKEEDLLEKTSTIQKLEKELEKLRASKSKENKPAVELEKSMSLEAVNPSSSDHLAVTAGGAKLQNLQNLVQSYEDSHGSQ